MTKFENFHTDTSCWHKAEDHEEMFILLGRDPAAPAAIEAWCQERLRRGLDWEDGPKIVSARMIANKIALEQRQKGIE